MYDQTGSTVLHLSRDGWRKCVGERHRSTTLVGLQDWKTVFGETLGLERDDNLIGYVLRQGGSVRGDVERAEHENRWKGLYSELHVSSAIKQNKTKMYYLDE